MKLHRPYELQEYDPAWKQRFLDAVEKLRPVFGDNLVEIDHIGSTSIIGMVAKPQVDVLAVVKNLDAVKDQHDAFVKSGFTPRGRGYVATDDEYMTEDAADGTRIVSVHTLQEGNPKVTEYKNFRDYLQKNEGDRNLYIATKRELYSNHRDNYADYDRGKKDVITAIKARAKQWAARKMMVELHAYVYGRVQMVMYRDFAQRNAREFGVVGWVHNLPDGRVEIVAQGERAALEAYLTKLHKGSLFSHVDKVEAEWCKPTERFDDFLIV